MSDAEKLANEIANVSNQIENISNCTRIYINTVGEKASKSQENVPPEECLEPLKEQMVAVLQRHRAKLIIELAEASGMRPDDERLAIAEGTEGSDEA